MAGARALPPSPTQVRVHFRETTRSITSQILAEATDIAQRGRLTDHEAACIDNGLNGGAKC